MPRPYIPVRPRPANWLRAHFHLSADRNERSPANLGITCGQHVESRNRCWVYGPGLPLNISSYQIAHNSGLAPFRLVGDRTRDRCVQGSDWLCGRIEDSSYTSLNILYSFKLCVFILIFDKSSHSNRSRVTYT